MGSVLDILEGRVTEELLRPLDENAFRFALGGCTFTNERSIGETLIINGVSHISWMQEGKLRNGSEKEAKAAFLMGVDPSQPAGILVHQSDPISLEDLYSDLAKKHPSGFAIVGSFLMDRFYGVYLKRAPIYGENVNDKHETYWSHEEEYQRAPVCIFGVVIPSSAKKTFPPEVLERAFYQNPLDKTKLPFDAHTHAALVSTLTTANDAGHFQHSLSRLRPTTIRHALNKSTINHGTYLILPLTALSPQ